MKKIIFISILVTLFIAIAIFIFISFKKNPAEQPSVGEKNSETAGLPAPTPAPILNEEINIDPITKLQIADNGKLLIKDRSNPIEINNFAKMAEVADNGVIYPIDKKSYNVGYNSTDNEFIVTLLVVSNIEKTRKDAENDLLKKLGIPEEDACKLKVYLYVSAALTDDKSLSQNHGLSFCAGSQSFPN